MKEARYDGTLLRQKSARFAIYHIAPSQLYVRLFGQYTLNTNKAFYVPSHVITRNGARLSVTVDIVIKPLGSLWHRSET